MQINPNKVYVAGKPLEPLNKDKNPDKEFDKETTDKNVEVKPNPGPRNPQGGGKFDTLG